MQPFDRYFREKMKDGAFRALYDAECNVCANTMRIFEKAELDNISLDRLAGEVNAAPEDLEALRDADHCDPHLVIRLCRRLGLAVPEHCPRLRR